MSDKTPMLKTFLPSGMSEEMFYILVAGLVALACVWAVSQHFVKRDSWGSRIRTLQKRRRELMTELNAPKKRKKPETSVNFMRRVAMKLELVKKLQLQKAEATLVHANFRSRDAIWVFAFFTLLLPFVFGGLGLAASKFGTAETLPKMALSLLWPVAGLYFGLNAPMLFVRWVRRKRWKAIQRALSDTLDLMTVCAEAGLSLSASLERVSRELGIAYPEMAEELTLTSIEMGFLPDRNKALMNLSERCGIREVRGIVTVLVQTEKYGTPIAQALRTLSAEFRQQRMMRAEAKAASLPAKMTVPMILFILPTLFIVIMTPAALSMMKNMKTQEPGATP